jgi:hypothetical protein
MTKMEFEYNNRKYIAENKFRIEYDKNEECAIPESFTKYYALSEFSIDALLKNYLYASHPFELNDPFDCFGERIDLTLVKEEITSARFDKTDKVMENKEIFGDLFESIGIISMTNSENENPILWANYTNKHKGFSVTYKKDAFNFEKIEGPFLVDYVDEFTKITCNTLDELLPQLLCLTMVKSVHWNQEKEWRFLYTNVEKMYTPTRDFGDKIYKAKENRKYYLPKNSIKEIKLGFYFFDALNNFSINNLGEFVIDLSKEVDSEYKKKLISFARSNNIPLKMMYLNKNNFSFTAESIEYEYIPDVNCFKYKRIE